MTEVSRDLLFARFNGNSAASREAIEQVQAKLDFCLPKSYIDFLLASDGGEGFIGQSYLVLWKADELINMNAAYHVAEFAPTLFLIGSDGGDEAFGFDTRSEVCTVVSVPFVGMDLQLAKVVAPDFGTFFSELFSS
jgi:SMI1 / KNR4 family (SUKH-1)